MVSVENERVRRKYFKDFADVMGINMNKNEISGRFTIIMCIVIDADVRQ